MSRENVEVVHQLYASISNREFDAAIALYADAAVLEVSLSASTEAGTFRGRREVAGWFGRWFNAFGTDYRLEIEDIRDLGDRVLVVQRHEGQGRTSGAPVEMRNAALFTARHGRITRVELYGDLAEALEAVGLSE